MIIISCAHQQCLADDIESYLNASVDEEWVSFNAAMAHKPIFQRGDLDAIKAFTKKLVSTYGKSFVDAEGKFVDSIPDTFFTCRLGKATISNALNAVDGLSAQREKEQIHLFKVTYRNDVYDQACLCFEDSILRSVELIKFFSTSQAAITFYNLKQKGWRKNGHPIIKCDSNGQDVLLLYDGKRTLLIDHFATLDKENPYFIVRTTIVLL